MRAVYQLAIATLIVMAVPGCGIIRGIEQWKCDHLGLCHFGIRPSAECGGHCGSDPAMPPPTVVPPPQLLPPPGVYPGYQSQFPQQYAPSDLPGEPYPSDIPYQPGTVFEG